MSLKYSFILSLTGWFLIMGASSEAVEATREFVAKPQWSMTQKAEAVNQQYFLEPIWLQRGDLLGTLVDAEGNLYICDKVTEQLIKLDPKGSEIFAVGGVGEGPELHQNLGEPVPWSNGLIARSDCSMPSKIIVYDESGVFRWDIEFSMLGEMKRLFWNGEYAIVSFVSTRFLPGGGEIVNSLRLLSEDGVEVKSVLMNRDFVDPDHRPTAEDMWTSPYVSVSEDGLCFVQQDLYGSQVDCYDQELNKLWSFDGGWKPEPLSPEELAESANQQIPETIHQTIRRMVARNDGEVWIQTWTTDENDEYVRFEAFGRDGIRLGNVHLFGIPKESGDWDLDGSKILWIADEYAGRVSTSETVPYITVFDLVPK